MSILKKTLLPITLSSLLVTHLFSKPPIVTDEKVIAFAEKMLSKYKTDSLKINKISIANKTAVKGAYGFSAYILKYDLSVKDKRGLFRKETSNDTLFVSSKGVVATNLFSIDGRNLTLGATPPIVKDIYYTKKNLIFGNIDAPKKILLFSDPYCPSCRELFPDLEKAIKGKEKEYALFLFHFPIEHVHPASKITSAILTQALRKGRGEEITSKLYNAGPTKIKNRLIASTNIDYIIFQIQQITGFRADKKELMEIDLKEVEKQIEEASNLGITGTPTMFLNGVRSEDISQ